MINLAENNFLSSYCKLDNDIAKEFYLPCMRNSLSYRRISGYFGSTIYIIAWDAMRDFIKNNGHIQIICSPYLSKEDSEAIKEGITSKNDIVLSKAIKAELENILSNPFLNKPARLLCCLINSGIIEIKIAVGIDDKPQNPTIEKLYHDKAGVFSDGTNLVGFRGSFNETYKGLSNDGNIESIDVFQSWDGGKDLERVEAIEKVFETLWFGRYDAIKTTNIPEEAQKYIRHKTSNDKWEELLDEINPRLQFTVQHKWFANNSIVLRTHQEKALDNWKKQGYLGIYQGCTGCGKTITAITAIRNQISRGKSVLVLVPSKELLQNWNKHIRRILSDLNPKILLCGDNNNSWKEYLSVWTSPPTENEAKITIAIMVTACKSEFIKRIDSGNHLFIVADEVHRMGSNSRRNFFSITAGSKLGLSATPERFGDPIGTDLLINYFGSILQPIYTLEKALSDGVLTQYYYYPTNVELTEEEQARWDKITSEISKRYAMNSNNRDKNIDTYLHIKQIERARIIKKAANKLDAAIRIVKENYKDGQKWLVYCEDINQLTQVCNSIWKLGIDAYKYYAEMDGDRNNTLAYFEDYGGVLVSIKCLDEGVDIPSTTHALILASSKNPREFIQRRGRILRKACGKNYSHLYDVIAVPSQIKNSSDDKSLSIVLSELARAIEFGSHAENPSCITDLKITALKFGIDYTKISSEGYEDDEE